MGNTVISDKYGNRRRVSDRDSSINLIPNLSEKKTNISNRPSGIDSIMNIYNRSKIKSENKELTYHYCIKGISSCQEKEDGSLWFYIGTYKIKVNFCPCCGYRTKGEMR